LELSPLWRLILKLEKKSRSPKMTIQGNHYMSINAAIDWVTKSKEISQSVQAPKPQTPVQQSAETASPTTDTPKHLSIFVVNRVTTTFEQFLVHAADGRDAQNLINDDNRSYREQDTKLTTMHELMVNQPLKTLS
jgi:hypothetical protein